MLFLKKKYFVYANKITAGKQGHHTKSSKISENNSQIFIVNHLTLNLIELFKLHVSY